MAKVIQLGHSILHIARHSPLIAQSMKSLKPPFLCHGIFTLHHASQGKMIAFLSGNPIKSQILRVPLLLPNN